LWPVRYSECRDDLTCKYMAGLGEHVEKDGRCSVRFTKLVTFREQGQGILRARRRRHGYLPLSDGAWTFVSGWG
jgi:hypothetical protein